MMSILKISFLSILAIAFIVVMNYIFGSSLLYQLYYFVMINLIFIFRKGIVSYFKLSKYWYFFALISLLSFTIFYIFSSKILIQVYDYDFGICNEFSLKCYVLWINVALTTILMMFNTVYTLELIITSITIKDIMNLPLNIKYFKSFILLRTLLAETTYRISNNDLLINTIPEFQINKSNGWIGKFKRKFLKKLILVMALFFFVLERKDVLGPLIENRLSNIHNKSK